MADVRGRKLSFLLGAATLLLSTFLYLLMWQTKAPFWGWAIASVSIGLGFTFFSGAVEAWLVDALGATGFTGNLETVFGRGQTIAGVAMLAGSVLGAWHWPVWREAPQLAPVSLLQSFGNSYASTVEYVTYWRSVCGLKLVFDRWCVHRPIAFRHRHGCPRLPRQ